MRKTEGAARPGSASNEFHNNGHHSIAQSLSADVSLAQHILRYHVGSLRDAWELCFIRSLTALKGDLSSGQASALSFIWQRIQREA